MNEKMPIGPTLEQQRQQEEQSRYAWWMENHPEKVIPLEKRECGPEIIEFENLIDLFKSKYPLEELNAIINLTPEESKVHPLREPAKEAKGPIVAKLDAIKKETDISEEKYEELQAQYVEISRAVGIINNGKVYHDR